MVMQGSLRVPLGLCCMLVGWLASGCGVCCVEGQASVILYLAKWCQDVHSQQVEGAWFRAWQLGCVYMHSVCQALCRPACPHVSNKSSLALPDSRQS